MPHALSAALGLVAFDAVLRCGTFSAAAVDLGLTQSAVSHRIARLERHFGTRLLDRSPSGPSPTAVGRAVAFDLATALDALGNLDAQARRKQQTPILRIGVGAALCRWWLLPRLPDFARRHRRLDVDIVVVETGQPDPQPLDVRILWLPVAEARATTTQRPIFQEEVLPVCAPQILTRGRALVDRRELLRLPLIHKGAETAGEWSWPVWLRRLGLVGLPARGGELRLSDMGLCLQAAVAGAGVALGRSLLVRDAIDDGRLTPALADRVAMPSCKLHVARWPARLAGDAHVAAFTQWIAAAAAVGSA